MSRKTHVGDWNLITPAPHKGGKPCPLWLAEVLVLLLALWLVGPVPWAAAQETESITVSGRVLNGTAGGTLPVGQLVRVVAIGAERVQGSWEAPLQADGSYTVGDAIRIPGATYAVGIEHAGGTYVDRVAVPDGSSAAVQDLTIYESVAVDPGIRFEQSAIVLASPNAERGTIEATEVHSLVNPTDRTFIPSAQGPGGPAGLLVFPLPAGAAELTPLMGLEPDQIAQIDRGFASLMPIYPGRTDLSFRYVIPSAESTLHLERTVRYPVELYRVLSSEPNLTLTSPQLAETTRADIGGRSFQTISGGPLDRGTVLSVDVVGLPTRGFTFGGVPLWTITALGALVGLGIVVQAMRRPVAVAHAMAPRDREDIIDRLLVLQQEHEAGRISEETYREGRQTLVAAALTLAPSASRRGNGGPH